MEVDEAFVKRLALQLTDIRVRLGVIRRLANLQGLPLETIDQEIDRAIDAGLESEEFRRNYEMVLKHLMGGD